MWHWSRWVQRGLLLFGLLLLGAWWRTDAESRAFQSAESMKLDAVLRSAESLSSEAGMRTVEFVGPAASELPTYATESRRVLGRIEIPRLRITAIVAEGSDTATLRHAIGHVPSTALPGKPGNCALAGHRDTFLRGLGDTRVNDVIRVITLEGTYTYQVEWSEVVEPQRVDVLDPTPARSLTIVTCYPFEFVGRAPQRFVVRARQIDAAAGHLVGPVGAGRITGSGSD